MNLFMSHMNVEIKLLEIIINILSFFFTDIKSVISILSTYYHLGIKIVKIMKALTLCEEGKESDCAVPCQ